MINFIHFRGQCSREDRIPLLRLLITSSHFFINRPLLLSRRQATLSCRGQATFTWTFSWRDRLIFADGPLFAWTGRFTWTFLLTGHLNINRPLFSRQATLLWTGHFYIIRSLLHARANFTYTGHFYANRPLKNIQTTYT